MSTSRVNLRTLLELQALVAELDFVITEHAKREGKVFAKGEAEYQKLIQTLAAKGEEHQTLIQNLVYTGDVAALNIFLEDKLSAVKRFSTNHKLATFAQRFNSIKNQIGELKNNRELLLEQQSVVLELDAIIRKITDAIKSDFPNTSYDESLKLIVVAHDFDTLDKLFEVNLKAPEKLAELKPSYDHIKKLVKEISQDKPAEVTLEDIKKELQDYYKNGGADKAAYFAEHPRALFLYNKQHELENAQLIEEKFNEELKRSLASAFETELSDEDKDKVLKAFLAKEEKEKLELEFEELDNKIKELNKTFEDPFSDEALKLLEKNNPAVVNQWKQVKDKLATLKKEESPLRQIIAKTFDTGKKIIDMIDDGWNALRQGLPHTPVFQAIGNALTGAVGFIIGSIEGIKGIKLAFKAYTEATTKQKKTRIATSIGRFLLGITAAALSVVLLVAAAGVTIAAAPLLTIIVPSAFAVLYGMGLWKNSYVLNQTKEEEAKAKDAYEAVKSKSQKLNTLGDEIKQLEEKRTAYLQEINTLTDKIAKQNKITEYLANEKELATKRTEYAAINGEIAAKKHYYDSLVKKRLEKEAKVAFSVLEVAAAAVVIAGAIIGVAALIGLSTVSFGIVPLILTAVGVGIGVTAKVIEKVDEKKHGALTANMRAFFVGIGKKFMGLGKAVTNIFSKKPPQVGVEAKQQVVQQIVPPERQPPELPPQLNSESKLFKTWARGDLQKAEKIAEEQVNGFHKEKEAKQKEKEAVQTAQTSEVTTSRKLEQQKESKGKKVEPPPHKGSSYH